MLTVHHLEISQSDRIVWLCEELGLDYEVKRYKRDPNTRLAPAEYKALHPSQTAPIISHGDLVLGETTAIFEYLLARYGGGRLTVGPDAPGYTDYLYWYHAGQGSFVPAVIMDMMIARGAPDIAAGNGPSRSDIAFRNIDDRLSAKPYLAGEEFTAADIMNFFLLTTFRLFVPRDLTPYPHIRAYLPRIAARPAFQRAMKKADPDLRIPLD